MNGCHTLRLYFDWHPLNVRVNKNVERKKGILSADISVVDPDEKYH